MRLDSKELQAAQEKRYVSCVFCVLSFVFGIYCASYVGCLSMHAPTCFIADTHDLVHFCFLRLHRAQKEAALAQRAKDKAKKTKGGFFGFGGSKAPTKEEEEVDAEQDHDDKEEVMGLCGVD